MLSTAQCFMIFHKHFWKTPLQWQYSRCSCTRLSLKTWCGKLVEDKNECCSCCVSVYVVAVVVVVVFKESGKVELSWVWAVGKGQLWWPRRTQFWGLFASRQNIPNTWQHPRLSPLTTPAKERSLFYYKWLEKLSSLSLLH